MTSCFRKGELERKQFAAAKIDIKILKANIYGTKLPSGVHYGRFPYYLQQQRGSRNCGKYILLSYLCRANGLHTQHRTKIWDLQT